MYTYYQDNQNDWRWRYVTNGRIIAVSSEGYRNEADCLRSIEIMKGSSNDPARKE